MFTRVGGSASAKYHRLLQSMDDSNGSAATNETNVVVSTGDPIPATFTTFVDVEGGCNLITSLNTTYQSDKAVHAYAGIMFTMATKQDPLTILTLELDVRYDLTRSAKPSRVQVYTVPGVYKNIWNSVNPPEDGWVLVADSTLVPAPEGVGAIIPVQDFTPVPIEGGGTKQSFYISLDDNILDSNVDALVVRDELAATTQDFDLFAGIGFDSVTIGDRSSNDNSAPAASPTSNNSSDNGDVFAGNADLDGSSSVNLNEFAQGSSGNATTTSVDPDGAGTLDLGERKLQDRGTTVPFPKEIATLTNPFFTGILHYRTAIEAPEEQQRLCSAVLPETVGTSVVFDFTLDQTLKAETMQQLSNFIDSAIDSTFEAAAGKTTSDGVASQPVPTDTTTPNPQFEGPPEQHPLHDLVKNHNLQRNGSSNVEILELTGKCMIVAHACSKRIDNVQRAPFFYCDHTPAYSRSMSASATNMFYHRTSHHTCVVFSERQPSNIRSLCPIFDAPNCS
jgi:hypothetical protein